jgi:xanthine dehydrogenase YagS FAD-binding subunit
MLPQFQYVRPDSVQDAVKALDQDGARVHAGGTDLLGCLRDRVFSADVLVGLSGLTGLDQVEAQADGLVIGALTTVDAVARHPKINEDYTVLAQAASEVASPQLRNQGTIGGNLCQKPRCWYYRGEFDCLRKGGTVCYAVKGQNEFHCILGGANCYIVHPSDIAPALVALGGKVKTAGPKGARAIDVERFYVHPADDPMRETVLQPGEIVTHVLVPAPQKKAYSRYRKIRTRQSWDFALAGTALNLVFDGPKVVSGRVAFSGVAPFPWRANAVEEVVLGKRLDDQTIAAAAKAAVRDAEPMSDNAYKVPLLKGVLTEELSKAAR